MHLQNGQKKLEHKQTIATITYRLHILNGLSVDLLFNYNTLILLKCLLHLNLQFENAINQMTTSKWKVYAMYRKICRRYIQVQ